MALLLCRQAASAPFYHAKLNKHVYTAEELSFLIYNYPILCLEGLLENELFDWLSDELHMEGLAGELRDAKANGTDSASMLYSILAESNYVSAAELSIFAGELRKLLRMEPGDFLLKEARTLYDVGMLRLSYEKYQEIIRKIDLELREADTASARKLTEAKAGCFCDMAVLSMKMFDEKRALELLVDSEITCQSDRARRLRYLINGEGDLPSDDRILLDSMKAEALENAKQTDAYKETEALFEEDSETVFETAERLIGEWKTEYRRTN